jgi:hypothetical protein
MLLLYLALAIASLRGEHDLVRVCPPPPSASRPSGQSRLEAAPKPPHPVLEAAAAGLEPGGLGGLC